MCARKFLRAQSKDSLITRGLIESHDDQSLDTHGESERDMERRSIEGQRRHEEVLDLVSCKTQLLVCLFFFAGAN